MDLTQLRYFLTVARAGSLTGASRELLISQPTLTVAVQRLEEALGTTLFLRDRRGVQLTGTGRELVHHVERVFQLLDEARERIAGLESEEVGQFVLGCPEALGAYFLPGFMADFLRRWPRIELTLWNGPSRAVQQGVVERNVHFGVAVNPLPHPELVLVPLFDDATDLFVGAAEAADSEAEAAERLRAGPLVVVPDLPQGQQLVRELAAQGLMPERRIECGDLELVKSLTLGGVGIGVLPRRVAAYSVPGQLVRLHESLPFVPDTIHLVYRADFHRTRAALLLKDGLVAAGKALSDGPGPTQMRSQKAASMQSKK